ncbi:MAG TPA: Uma2 family endonuclease [Polyangiaceae bacterium]|nr:Uma2 family endonuclease [Polyangiaceae bacterium]
MSEQTHAEILEGEIVIRPSPTPAHQSASAELYAELRAPFQRGRGGPGGWWLIPDVDVEFGPYDICRPDLTGWRREHLPDFPATRPIRTRPDWICEALSPGTALRDQGYKRDLYQRAGVPWYWMLDPVNRTITVLRWIREGYVLDHVAGDAGKAALPPFEGFEIELETVFPPRE